MNYIAWFYVFFVTVFLNRYFSITIQPDEFYLNSHINACWREYCFKTYKDSLNFTSQFVITITLVRVDII